MVKTPFRNVAKNNLFSKCWDRPVRFVEAKRIIYVCAIMAAPCWVICPNVSNMCENLLFSHCLCQQLPFCAGKTCPTQPFQNQAHKRAGIQAVLGSLSGNGCGYGFGSDSGSGSSHGSSPASVLGSGPLSVICSPLSFIGAPVCDMLPLSFIRALVCDMLPPGCHQGPCLWYAFPLSFIRAPVCDMLPPGCHQGPCLWYAAPWLSSGPLSVICCPLAVSGPLSAICCPLAVLRAPVCDMLPPVLHQGPCLWYAAPWLSSGPQSVICCPVSFIRPPVCDMLPRVLHQGPCLWYAAPWLSSGPLSAICCPLAVLRAPVCDMLPPGCPQGPCLRYAALWLSSGPQSVICCPLAVIRAPVCNMLPPGCLRAPVCDMLPPGCPQGPSLWYAAPCPSSGPLSVICCPVSFIRAPVCDMLPPGCHQGPGPCLRYAAPWLSSRPLSVICCPSASASASHLRSSIQGQARQLAPTSKKSISARERMGARPRFMPPKLIKLKKRKTHWFLQCFSGDGRKEWKKLKIIVFCKFWGNVFKTYAVSIFPLCPSTGRKNLAKTYAFSMFSILSLFRYRSGCPSPLRAQQNGKHCLSIRKRMFCSKTIKFLAHFIRFQFDHFVSTKRAHVQNTMKTIVFWYMFQ